MLISGVSARMLQSTQHGTKEPAPRPSPAAWVWSGPSLILKSPIALKDNKWSSCVNAEEGGLTRKGNTTHMCNDRHHTAQARLYGACQPRTGCVVPVAENQWERANGSLA